MNVLVNEIHGPLLLGPGTGFVESEGGVEHHVAGVDSGEYDSDRSSPRRPERAVRAYADPHMVPSEKCVIQFNRRCSCLLPGWIGRIFSAKAAGA